MRPSLIAALLLATGAASAQQRPPFIVFFPLWSGAIDDAAKGVIDQAAAHLKSGGHATVTGFSDAAGTPQSGVYLSELRAQRVIDALVADGVDADRLKLNAAGRQPEAGVADRRVEIAIEP